MEPIFDKNKIIQNLNQKYVYVLKYSNKDNSVNVQYLKSLKDIIDENRLNNIPSLNDVLFEIRKIGDGIILDILELDSDNILTGGFLVYIIQKLMCVDSIAHDIDIFVRYSVEVIEKIMHIVKKKLPNSTIIYKSRKIIFFDKKLDFPIEITPFQCPIDYLQDFPYSITQVYLQFKNTKYNIGVGSKRVATDIVCNISSCNPEFAKKLALKKISVVTNDLSSCYIMELVGNVDDVIINKNLLIKTYYSGNIDMYKELLNKQEYRIFDSKSMVELLNAALSRGDRYDY